MQVAKNVEFPTADWEEPEKLINVNMVSVYSSFRGPLARYSHNEL
jgi:hypothetical protein